MFKKLSIAEQAEVLKAAAILEKYYNPDHVKVSLEVMGNQLDKIEAEAEEFKQEWPITEQTQMDFEVIQGPQGVEQKESVETDDNMEIGGTHAQENLFDIEPGEKEIGPNYGPYRPFTRKLAEEIANKDYGLTLNELLVTKYYKEHMTQRQIAEKIFKGRTKQRTISTWLNEVPKTTAQRVLSGSKGVVYE